MYGLLLNRMILAICKTLSLHFFWEDFLYASLVRSKFSMPSLTKHLENWSVKTLLCIVWETADNNTNLHLSVYYVTDTVLIALHVLAHLIFLSTP